MEHSFSSSHSSAEPSAIGDDEDKDEKPQVFEGKLGLVPACAKLLGTHKGKDMEGQPSTIPLAAQRCGQLDLCEQSKTMPTLTPHTPYRLTTSDPAQDLQRWLLTPNDQVSGEDQKRGDDFPRNLRYTNDMLLDTIELAIDEIRSAHLHVRSLLDYASRSPYNRAIRINERANMRYLSLEAGDLVGVARKQLLEELLDAAYELDWLRAKADEVGEKIIRYKAAEAEDGDWAEVEDLLRLGLVDEAWVQEYCRV